MIFPPSPDHNIDEEGITQSLTQLSEILISKSFIYHIVSEIYMCDGREIMFLLEMREQIHFSLNQYKLISMSCEKVILFPTRQTLNLCMMQLDIG